MNVRVPPVFLGLFGRAMGLRRMHTELIGTRGAVQHPAPSSVQNVYFYSLVGESWPPTTTDVREFRLILHP